MKSKITVAIFSSLIVGLLVLSLVMPKSEILTSERRAPAKFPDISGKSILSTTFMTSFETYTQDNFPIREVFRGLKSFVNNYILLRGENNGVYKYNGYISEVEYPMNEDSMERAANKFKALQDKYFPENENVYFSVIPDKNKYTEGKPKMDYALFENKMRELFSSAQYIEISHMIGLEDYYQTDTHLRQEKIIDVAKHLALTMGKNIDNSYETKELENTFYGVYTGRWALPTKGDRLYYLTNAEIDDLTVTNFETGKTGGVYDMEKAAGLDPYEIFLSGPISLLTVENPALSDGSHLIIFRDSFASAVAPILSEGWQKITLVDIRYINSAYLSSLVDFEGADVLFLYSTLVLNNSETLK